MAQQNPWETASFHTLTILKQTETLVFMTALPRCPQPAFTAQRSRLQGPLPKGA